MVHGFVLGNVLVVPVVFNNAADIEISYYDGIGWGERYTLIAGTYMGGDGRLFSSDEIQ